MLSSEQIVERYEELIQLVNDYFEGTQLENILDLLKHFENNNRLIDTPASGKPMWHNCFVGGYLDHTVRVIKTALDIKQLFISMGVEVTADDDNIVLASLAHDLGKLGDLDEPYYVLQTDEWRRNKLDEWYTFNKKLEPMSVTDRSLWLLQHFDVKLNQPTWKAIKLSDGMFEEGNQRFFRGDANRNILHYIVHFADWISTTAEKQQYFQTIEEYSEETVSKQISKSKKSKPYKENTNPGINKKQMSELKTKFNELFGEES